MNAAVKEGNVFVLQLFIFNQISYYINIDDDLYIAPCIISTTMYHMPRILFEVNDRLYQYLEDTPYSHPLIWESYFTKKDCMQWKYKKNLVDITSQQRKGFRLFSGVNNSMDITSLVQTLNTILDPICWLTFSIIHGHLKNMYQRTIFLCFTFLQNNNGFSYFCLS